MWTRRFLLRVTADRNVIISGLNFSGNPRHVLEMAEDGAIHLAVSDAILDEVERVLRRTSLAGQKRRSIRQSGNLPVSQSMSNQSRE
jgi:predicted nucleic acid-binding protein